MKAYSGVKDYAFVSYSHADSQKVMEILDKMSLAGTRIWYDEGIAPSNDYIDAIAKKIEGCAFFIAFVSASSLASHYCADEIRFAYEEKKPMMVVRLDEAEFPVGMKLILNRYQSHSVGNAEKAEFTAKKLLPSVPSDVMEQKGILLYTDINFSYYLQSMETEFSNQPGYRMVAFSNCDEKQFTVLEKRLPYGSEYEVCYVTNSKHCAGVEIVLDVTWDFTFARNLPQDDYFMTRLLYEVSSVDTNTPPKINERAIYRESYTTGEKIFFDYVKNQGTIVKKDGTKEVGFVSASDPLRLTYL